MRKSYYVMHKLLLYAKNVLSYSVIITLCGNYYVMRRHTRPPLVRMSGMIGLNSPEAMHALNQIHSKTQRSDTLRLTFR